MQVVGALKQLGARGLYLGAGARCVHVTSYIVAQFLIYDSIKRLCGIPVAGPSLSLSLLSLLLHIYIYLSRVESCKYIMCRQLECVWRDMVGVLTGYMVGVKTRLELSLSLD